MSHTYAKLPVPAKLYAFVRKRFEQVGYEHAIHDDALVMNGLALVPSDEVEDGSGLLLEWMKRATDHLARIHVLEKQVRDMQARRCGSCKNFQGDECAVIGIGQGRRLPVASDFGCVFWEKTDGV